MKGESMSEKPEKVVFTLTDTNEDAEFYVVGQTRINNVNYILVTESMDEEDAEALILKETGNSDDEQDIMYDIVDDDVELEAIGKVFSEILDDIDIEME